VNKQILRLAIPNILTSISIPLLGAVDTALVGHLGKIHFIGAVAVGSMLFNFLYWPFESIRMGTTALTAQAHGRGDEEECHLILVRSVILLATIGILFVVLQRVISFVCFYFIPGSPEVIQFASQYFHIRILAAPAAMIYMAFHGWFLGRQNAKYPLLIVVLVNVLNIILNVYFVKYRHMTSDGVALGTCISQYVGLALAVALYIRTSLKVNIRGLIFNKKRILQFKNFFRVNGDLFFRTLALSCVYAFFTIKSANQGDAILAANSILMQFWYIYSYGIDGFAFAAESLVGKFYGAKDITSLRLCVKQLFKWGIAMGLVITTCYLTFGKSILSLFTNSQETVALAYGFFTWTIISCVINIPCFIWDGIYIGATATRTIKNIMFAAVFLVFAPIYFIFHPLFKNHGLWFALICFMFARGLLLTIYAEKSIFTVCDIKKK